MSSPSIFKLINMDIRTIALEQFSFTFNRSKGQIELLYNLCDQNYNRFISLEETLAHNHIFFCPTDKKTISELLKKGKDDRYSYFRATVDNVIQGFLELQWNNKQVTIPIPNLKEMGKGYKYSMEICKNGVWTEGIQYLHNKRSKDHWALMDIDGERRNAKCLEETRIDRIYYNPYNREAPLDYEYNYDVTNKKPGLPVFIIDGEIHLFNSQK